MSKEINIAVLSKNANDFRLINFKPLKALKRIRNINDIRGIRFDGIIKTHKWYECSGEIADAYECLKQKQPELFINQ